ncbi:E3 ubiquitin-protein ligase TRIM56-like [Ruditapes philippinarum]|uniref:E3 ubiquitin-protein ligase TRIM56-like n=1 Tax=Ruditapes philippinarum TaxID=129788 RepID=UPI00295B21BE|nr:E3 ubiquitin-protein ligase TRIM56-like [Ruditapes philippinarum]
MADRDRDTFIKCGICSEKFDKPKILPCFHTVCHKCLENIVELTAQNGRFECPFCRMGITVPENGASGFQTNFYIYSSDVISELDCDVCGVSQSAIHECKQCDQNFCKGCGSIHSRIASSANHTLVNISSGKKENDKGPASAPCNNHPSMEITDVCKDCNELVCTACITMFHVGHSCNAVSKEAEDRRNELRELISISENNLIEMEKDTRVVKRQSESKYKFFNEQICELRK